MQMEACLTWRHASTVLELFVSATSEFGFPSHIPSDKGPENRLVALHVLSQLGTNRNSTLTGRSSHNQRIERFYVPISMIINPRRMREGYGSHPVCVCVCVCVSPS